jgi:hypothetical protein
LTICACYSWELVLYISLITSFNNIQDWIGIWEKPGNINTVKAYVTNDEISYWIFNSVLKNNTCLPLPFASCIPHHDLPPLLHPHPLHLVVLTPYALQLGLLICC